MSQKNRFKKITFVLLAVSAIIVSVFVFRTYFFERLKASDTQFINLTYSQKISYIEKISAENPRRAWEILVKSYVITNSKEISQDPHALAHIVGNNSYKKSGIDGIKICEQYFSFGCFHGVTESMVRELGKTQIPKIEKSCMEIESQNTQNITGCIHGTGHGLFTANNYDLKMSLNDCELFQLNNRQYCYDGVFMEFSENPQLYSQSQTPHTLCDNLSPQHQPNCARFLVQIFGNLSDWDINKIISGCEKVIPLQIKSECATGVGYYVVFTSTANPDYVYSVCDKFFSLQNKTECIMGAIRQIISQKYADHKSIGRQLCSKYPSNEDLCLKEIESLN